jgi:hypothetical protein
MKLKRLLVPSLLAGSLLVGSTSGTFAAQKKAAAHSAFAYGQVSNLSAAGFTLTRTSKKAATAPKVFQVILNSTTKEKARKGTAGALANGEYAFVAGANGTSGISASGVLYSNKAFNAHRLIQRIRAHRSHRAAGLVNASATTSSSLSITTAKGKTLVFAIGPQTKYRVNKVLATAAPTFTNGEKVRVSYTRNSATKTLTAREIGVR